VKLNQLADRSGSAKDRKRVGRGIGSGKGKTAGRGYKGQSSRTGVALNGFEGGQMPLHRRLPKRGFNNIFSKDYNELNLDRIQTAVDAGKIDPKKPVTAAALKEAGVIRRVKSGVRILGRGELKAAVNFEVAGATKSAAAAIEKAGGSVKTV
jgi:large subunit ribosomal protein L15